ncbi:MAG: hypothetical protein R3A10_02555 [Caldilineaceae bacterium]
MTRPTTETTPTPAAAWPPAVVTVNWNLAGETVPCVASAGRGRGPGATTSWTTVRRTTPGNHAAPPSTRVRIIESATNLALPAATTWAFSRRWTTAAWVLLINNDYRIAPDFLARFAAGHGRPSRLALISPLILYHDEPDRIWSLGDYRIPGTLFTRHILRNRTVPADPLPFMPVDFQRLRHPGARRCLRPHRAAG